MKALVHCLLILVLTLSPLRAQDFKHHVVSTDIPADVGWGYGTPALADFDRDGDLDFAFGARTDSLYWFEFQEWGTWSRHTIGPMPLRTLGGASMDVDDDGWTDVVIGGYWFENTGGAAPFDLHEFDARIDDEIHDIVIADVNGDGSDDVVVSGDSEGAFWYDVPADPTQPWVRHLITTAVLEHEDAIHSGFFPRGVADLDGDADVDIVLPDRWLENEEAGRRWIEHALPSGSRGPWGLSARSWVTDLDEDGDPDIVMVDSDQTESGAYWLENVGGGPPSFDLHALPITAAGRRGSFHSLAVADLDLDGDLDVFAAEQEDQSIAPEGAGPRWFVWEQVDGQPVQFRERIVLDANLGGHDALVGDVDGDGDPDVCSKIWKRWDQNANEGREHADCIENLTIR